MMKSIFGRSLCIFVNLPRADINLPRVFLFLKASAFLALIPDLRIRVFPYFSLIGCEGACGSVFRFAFEKFQLPEALRAVIPVDSVGG